MVTTKARPEPNPGVLAVPQLGPPTRSVLTFSVCVSNRPWLLGNKGVEINTGKSRCSTEMKYSSRKREISRWQSKGHMWIFFFFYVMLSISVFYTAILNILTIETRVKNLGEGRGTIAAGEISLFFRENRVIFGTLRESNASVEHFTRLLRLLTELTLVLVHCANRLALRSQSPHIRLILIRSKLRKGKSREGLSTKLRTMWVPLLVQAANLWYSAPKQCNRVNIEGPVKELIGWD